MVQFGAKTLQNNACSIAVPPIWETSIYDQTFPGALFTPLTYVFGISFGNFSSEMNTSLLYKNGFWLLMPCLNYNYTC
jgi:hypothetical protein